MRVIALADRVRRGDRVLIVIDSANDQVVRRRFLQLPRMADFTFKATACETVVWPARTFLAPMRETAERPPRASSKAIG